VINQAHAELARQLSKGAVCTVPITGQGEILGALTLERESGQALTDADILEIEQLLALVAPGLWLQHRDGQALPVKAGHSLRDTATKLFGPEHIKLKLASLAAIILLGFFSFAQGDWRVTAKAVVEGSVQRTIAAPIDGYISSVEAGAGDVVTANQPMGALDDSDLRLQRLKWSTLRQQMVSESREAMAQHNRAEVSIISAKIDQADAELDLIDEQLARTRLLAPFDGIVIEGDLSQRLGTPVSRGDILFKVAPMDDYRIVLKVDEQDIAPIAPGQTGKLILASMPSRVLEMRVDKITPVSTAEEGHNFFRVEASLLEEDLLLQPGMEGVGKIAVGEANLFWIWTHDMVNWLQLRAWTWWR
jgi:multidrug resistance efflux pump